MLTPKRLARPEPLNAIFDGAESKLVGRQCLGVNNAIASMLAIRGRTAGLRLKPSAIQSIALTARAN